METMEYYKLIRNSIKIYKVELVSLNCIKREIEKTEDKNARQEVQMLFQRDVKVVTEDQAELYLHAKIGIQNGPFDFDLVYKGICVKTIPLSKPQFEQYAYDQVVPLLLPYVRECISSTMARMGLPIFTLPTMDVLDSLEANMNSNDGQE